MPIKPLKNNITTFEGDIIRLISGNGIAQIILLFAAPILSRLYSPEAFGEAAGFGAITTILGVIACLRYELAIVLPDNHREAVNLLCASIGLSVIISIFTIPIILYGGNHILRWINMTALAPYLWMIPIVTLINGSFNALNYWNTRTKHFTRLSFARITGAITNVTSSLSVGFVGNSATGGALVAASAGGQSVTLTILGVQIWNENKQFILTSISLHEMWSGMKRFRKFPLYSSWSSLLNSASWMAPVILLGGFFSPLTVGYYSLGFRVLQTPLNLMGGALSQVFYQRAALARTNGTLPSLVEGLFLRLFIIGIQPCLIIAILGKEIFMTFFGINWAEAGIYAQLLAPWALIWFISSPLSTVYLVLEQQHREPAIQGVILFSRIIPLTIGGFIGNEIVAISLFSIGGFIAYGYLVKVIFNCISKSIFAIIKKQKFLLPISILHATPTLILKYLNVDLFAIITVSSLMTLIFFFIYRKVLMKPTL